MKTKEKIELDVNHGNIEAIIFDFDGVIVTGTNEGYYVSNNEVIKELFKKWRNKAINPYDAEKVNDFVRKYWGTTAVKVLTEYILPYFFDNYNGEEENKAVGDFTKTLKNYYVERGRIAPGIKQFVKEILPRYKRAIVSATNDEIIRAVLSKERINEFFETIVCGHKIPDLHLHKPHPYMLQEAMRLIGSKPETTLYIGDAEADVIMARRAGVRPIVVTTGSLDYKSALNLGLPEGDIITSITHLTAALK